MHGEVFQLNSVGDRHAAHRRRRPVPAARRRTPTASSSARRSARSPPPTTAPSTRRFPAAATAALQPGRATDYRETLRIEVLGARLRGRRPARQRLLGGARRRAGRLRRGHRRARRAGPRELVRLLQGLGQAGRDVPVHAARANYKDVAGRRRRGHDQRAGRDHAARRRHLGRRPDPGGDRGRAGRRLEGVRGEGRHARAGSRDRLEGPLDRRHARRRHRDQPRPEGDPARRRLRDRPLRRPPVPGRARSTSPTARTAPARAPSRLATQDQRPGHAGLHVQPLPGDVLRPAVPARGRCRRTASPAPAGTTRRASPSRRTPRSPTPAAASRTPRCRATPTSSSSRSGSATAGTSSPARPTTTATTPRARR